MRSDAAKVELESGPAVRHIDQVTGPDTSTVAARASLNLSWAISPTLELKQAGAIYFEEEDRNATELTALDARLFGPLEARFSYDARYEARLRTGRSTLDTLSRATLVYRFRRPGREGDASDLPPAANVQKRARPAHRTPLFGPPGHPEAGNILCGRPFGRVRAARASKEVASKARTRPRIGGRR
jgi:hypothetical protein